MQKWKILLIGGPIATGKTTVAEKLSIKYKIPYLAVDDIRVAMQQVADRKNYPYLFTYIEKQLDVVSSESLNSLTTEFEAFSEVLWQGIRVIIENHLANNQPIIIEGDALLPRLIHEFPKNTVKALFLYDDEQALYDREIHRAGTDGNSKRYKQYIAWQTKLGKKYAGDAKKHGYWNLKTSPIDSFYARVLATIEPRSWMSIE